MKGTCPVCGGRFQVTAAGEIRAHGKPKRCPGSGSDPEPSVMISDVAPEGGPTDIEKGLAWLIDNSEGVVGLRLDGQVMPWTDVLAAYLPWWSADFLIVLDEDDL